MKRYHLAAALAAAALWLGIAASAVLAQPSTGARWLASMLLAGALTAATGGALSAGGATRRRVTRAMLAVLATAVALLLVLDPLAA
jgi:hypothetical protein